MHFTTASLVAISVATVSAYTATRRSFAVNHFYGKGPLLTSRMDPIVNPGVAASHVHTIQGGSNFALTMTDTQLMDSNCTSSRIKNDKSNYWTPSLYFVDPKTGSIESVEMFYMNVYYFFEGTTDKIKAFKPGHRMVIGNSNLRTPPATGGSSILDNADGVPQPIQWTCPRSSPTQPLYPPDSDGLHGVGIQDPHNKGTGVGFPDKNCDGYASPLRADIHFPSCWNPAEGLTNYKTNMAWPTKGNCPAGYVHVPHLFYEVYWNTPKFASRWTPGQGTQPFVLSNGDPTGYGLHGDFLSGWDEATLQQMIDNCDAGDSGMDKCPGLIGGVNDPSTSCNIKSSVSETVSGVLSALPGNNPIGKWGVDAVPKVMLPASSASSAKSSATTSITNTRAVDGIINTETVSKASATSSAESSVTTSYKTTTTSVTKTVTATTGLSLPSASSSPLPQGWTYYGCYSDNSNRVLSGLKFVTVKNGIINNTNCAAACDSRGFSMAGTEYGGQCFCGNNLNGSTKLDESKCSMPCKNSTQICGGSYALSVYSKSSAKRSTSKRERSHMHNRMVRVAHKG